jgi:hypothetical protein
MIDLKKKLIFEEFKNKQKTKTVSTQTDEFSFYLSLGKGKSLHMYISKSYRDKVVCLKFSNNKNYIITREIWQILENNMNLISNHFKNE